MSQEKQIHLPVQDGPQQNSNSTTIDYTWVIHWLLRLLQKAIVPLGIAIVLFIKMPERFTWTNFGTLFFTIYNTYSLLSTLAPKLVDAFLHGMGFGIGYSLTNKINGVEPFKSCTSMNNQKAQQNETVDESLLSPPPSNSSEPIISNSTTTPNSKSPSNQQPIEDTCKCPPDTQIKEKEKGISLDSWVPPCVQDMLGLSREQKKSYQSLCHALLDAGFNPKWTFWDVKEKMRTEDGLLELERIDRWVKNATGFRRITNHMIETCFPHYLQKKPVYTTQSTPTQ